MHRSHSWPGLAQISEGAHKNSLHVSCAFALKSPGAFPACCHSHAHSSFVGSDGSWMHRLRAHLSRTVLSTLLGAAESLGPLKESSFRQTLKALGPSQGSVPSISVSELATWCGTAVGRSSLLQSSCFPVGVSGSPLHPSSVPQGVQLCATLVPPRVLLKLGRDL